MNNYSICHNKNLFIIYVGLTAAGYDLAKTPDIGKLDSDLNKPDIGVVHSNEMRWYFV